MNTLINRTFAFFAVVCLLSSASAHPVFQHHFNNIVNANPCLKNCMDQATGDGLELSLLKTANISGYLLNLETVCRVITTARSCVANCGVESNPFALESMNAICSPSSLLEVETIKQCLTEQGDEVVEQCKEQCGDYDEINDHVHKLTEAFRPDRNEPEKIVAVMAKISDACGTLKCSDRCAVKLLNEQCSEAGNTVRNLIEKVLKAQRIDLEKMQLLDAMAHSVPKQCNFMYMPEVMFNETKDTMALAVIDEVQRNEHVKKLVQAGPPMGEVNEGEKKKLSFVFSQLQAHLLRKQIHLLDMQEKYLMRENLKMDMEMQIIARKRLQQNLEDGVIKQQF
jgi:hypothetical protein